MSGPDTASGGAAVAELFSLDGRVAIVTGASGGLGRRFAETLAKAGAKVALAARHTERLSELAAEIEAFGGEALPVAVDVTDPAAIARAVAAAEAGLGPISILVNNAGIVVDKPLLETEEADWDRVLDTNLKGAWLMAREVAGRMAKAGGGGRIINIASILGQTAAGRVHGYAASKAALIHLTRTMAVELARYGIRVNAIAPGYVETDLNRDFLAGPAGESLVKRVPLRRFARPEDLDAVLLLLASEAGSYMTGSTVTVDGGLGLSAL